MTAIVKKGFSMRALAAGAAIAALCMLSACGMSHDLRASTVRAVDENAALELRAKGIPFTQAAFLDSVISGQKEVVALFLRAGMDPNARDSGARDRGPDRTGWTALLWALWERHTDIAEILMDHGADPNLRGKATETTALNLAITHARESLAMKAIRLGAKLEVADLDGRTPVFLAARDDRMELLQLLIGRRVNIDVVDRIGRTPLTNALRSRQRLAVNYLLETGARPSAGSDSALLLAAEIGWLDVVQRLLPPGSSARSGFAGPDTPLAAAARNGHSEVVKFLIGKGADVNQGLPLLGAAYRNRADIVALLLESGSNVNAVDEQGRSALWLSCADDHEHVMRMLLDRGANANLPSKYGETPLMRAVQAGQATAAKLLIAHRADINAKDQSGKSVLGYAGKWDAVRALLVANGAKQ